ncbi:MAG TPA: bifunctional hydroxymethylpyrimidine kinase/phosphomethylpyrimidine kinase [Abditibacteriaceae bacterium]|jgi:hydroxymethylpyrimidine/phosphomethylpyrimidine kinase
MFKALTIAGSDSGGGAGIQADLKTFAARGVYGTCALTAITAQNTLGVSAVLELPTEIIAAQIDAVLNDIGTDSAKTGMLSSVPIIETVAAKLRAWRIENLVVDPVMVAKSGDRLLREEAVQAVREQMLPLALVLTPNLYEAEILLGRAVRTVEEMKDAARDIAAMGACNVVVKGGRRDDQVIDILFDGRECIEYSTPHIDTRNTQGTGCTFSAAIASELAKGANVCEAVAAAKTYVTSAMRQAPAIGAGHGPLQHFPLWQP